MNFLKNLLSLGLSVVSSNPLFLVYGLAGLLTIFGGYYGCKAYNHHSKVSKIRQAVKEKRAKREAKISDKVDVSIREDLKMYEDAKDRGASDKKAKDKSPKFLKEQKDRKDSYFKKLDLLYNED